MPDDASFLVKLDIHPEDLAEKMARGLVQFYREPENLAALSGGILLPLIVFRGRRVPFLPVFVVAMMGVQGGKMAYRASENLRVIAQAAAGQVPEVSCTPPGDA